MIPLPVTDEDIEWPHIAIVRTKTGWAWDIFQEDESRDRGAEAESLVDAFAAIIKSLEN